MITPLDVQKLSTKAAIICAIDLSIDKSMPIYVYQGALDTWYWRDYGQHANNNNAYPHYRFCVDFVGGIARERNEWKQIVEVPLFSIGEEVEVLSEEDGWHDGKILDIFIHRPALRDEDRDYRTDWDGVVGRDFIRKKTHVSHP